VGVGDRGELKGPHVGMGCVGVNGESFIVERALGADFLVLERGGEETGGLRAAAAERFVVDRALGVSYQRGIVSGEGEGFPLPLARRRRRLAAAAEIKLQVRGRPGWPVRRVGSCSEKLGRTRSIRLSRQRRLHALFRHSESKRCMAAGPQQPHRSSP
jgi:hypothetical protein